MATTKPPAVPTQLISVGFGRITFAAVSASLSAFVVEPPFKRTIPSKNFKRQGACQRFPASRYPNINGNLYLDSVSDIPDGTIIALQCSQRQRGASVSDGAIMIAMRKSGPLLSVTAKLPYSDDSLLTGGFLTFQGRGDILTPKELEDYGLEAPDNYIRGFMDEEEVDENFTIAITAPATGERPRLKVEVDNAGETVLVADRPRRRTNLRRGG